MNIKNKYYSFLIVFLISFLSCNKSEDNIPAQLEINNFVWKGLNAYYLWQNEVPDLQDSRFNNQNQLNSYLSGFPTPENLFGYLIHTPTDRFSWIVDDYVALENSFQGITLNNGMQFNLYRNKTNTTNIYGVVYYVIPGSDAERKGVLREMVFSSINGIQLTEANYRSQLFGSNETYTIGLADFNAGNPTLNGSSILLTKEQLQENPIVISKTFDEGSKKIGYLLYNQFASSYDGELNSVFADFKTKNITDLIIDLRYNGGGSVRTATYLGSMINGTNTGKIFSQEVWNQKVNENVNPDFLVNNFTNQILNKDRNGNTILDESINSLSLQTVYFIVSENTASASELVINGMSAYIDVKLVGTKTVGKQVGSITLYDSDNYLKNGANLNPNHTYAMQPIVLEIKNAKGENNPDGYTPDIILPEDFGREDNTINLGVLGEKSDPLLSRTIDYITTGLKSNGKINLNFVEKPFINSKLEQPFSQEMFVEGFRK